MTKKMFSKVTTMLLSLIMVLGVIASSVTAFAANGPTITGADGDGSITINKLYTDSDITAAEYADLSAEEQAAYVLADDGKYYKPVAGAEYTIYKIATIVQSTNGSGDVTVEYKDVNSSAVLDLGTLKVSDVDLSNYTATAAATTNASGYVKFSTLDLGLYLVIESGLPTGVSAANNFFVQVPMTTTDGSGNAYWEYDIVSYPKNSENDAAIKKEIAGGTVTDPTITNGETAHIGDTVTYKVTVDIPSDIDSTTAPYTKFDIIDKTSPYLTVNTSTIAIISSLGTVYTTPADYTVSQATDGSNNTTTTIAFTAAGIAKLAANEVLTINYAAKIDPATPSTVTSVTNGATIEYLTKDMDPEDPEIVVPKPDDPDPVVYLYNYAFKKVDANNAALAGATFVLAQDNVIDTDADGIGDAIGYLTYSTTAGWGYTATIGNAYKLTSTATGVINFSGLTYGSYKLIEVSAPTDYTLLKDPISITIDATSTAAANLTSGSNYSIQVINNKNTDIELPTTGGMGIYLFMIIGGVLVAAAVVLFAISRKKNSAQS